MRQIDVMKAIQDSIGLGICALAALLAGCGGKQCSPMPPMPRPTLPRAFTQTVEVFQVSFDMVLVPGDEAKGIKTLYVGRHEVTWDELMPWIYAGDYGEIGENPKAMALRKKRLCPTEIPYGDITHGFGCEKFPAMRISRLHAEVYCEWLSAETGRAYRLPDNEEWEHIFRLGRGGAPDNLTEEEAKQQAVYEGTSWAEELGDWQTFRVGSKAPDRLGIHDMVGNVAEWVTGTGTNRVVRGGHFRSKQEELGLRGWLVENASWNENMPNISPGNRCWCVDAPWTGFRLVCEP